MVVWSVGHVDDLVCFGLDRTRIKPGPEFLGVRQGVGRCDGHQKADSAFAMMSVGIRYLKTPRSPTYDSSYPISHPSDPAEPASRNPKVRTGVLAQERSIPRSRLARARQDHRASQRPLHQSRTRSCPMQAFSQKWLADNRLRELCDHRRPEKRAGDRHPRREAPAPNCRSQATAQNPTTVRKDC